jgi:hypothetical protein
MNEQRALLGQDLMTLHYWNALNAGDLEAVAALWDQASRDRELERIMAEVDSVLYAEEHAENRNAGKAHEGAQVPKSGPVSRRRRWRVWAIRVGTLAAACVLAMLVCFWRNRDSQDPGPATSDTNRQVALPAADRLIDIPANKEAEQILNLGESAAFRWPFPLTSSVMLSTAIPPDLLE